MDNPPIYVVTELNTHRDTYDNEYEEILYGKPYVRHEFATREDAKAHEASLNARGITTNLTEEYHA